MKREGVRRLKRAMSRGLKADASGAECQAAKDAMHALLQRSVEMRHTRLAILRFVEALRLGVQVDARCSAYVMRLVHESGRDVTLRDLVLQAARATRVEVHSR